MTWDDIVTQAFVDMGVIQPGETLAATYTTDGETRLNQLLSSLSTEELTAFNQVRQSWNLSAGVSAYTLGSGGSFATTGGLRAQKVTSWRATYASPPMNKGGPVMSLAEFGAAAAQADNGLGATSTIPQFVGADTAYPLINVRIWPPPNSAPGALELAYFTPVTQITNFAATISLPEGWPDMLHFNLAVRMYPIYGRATGIPPELAANAQNTKAALIAQNTMGAQPGAAQ